MAMVVLLTSLLTPLIATPVVMVLRDWKRGAVASAIVIGVSCIALLYAAVLAFEGLVIEEAYPVAPELALVELQGDGFNLTFAVLIAFLSVAVALYSGEYMHGSPSPSAYFTLYLIYVSAMMGAVVSGSLTTFFLFFELMLVPSWALIAYWGTGRREAVALKYFLFTETGALLTMAGMALIYDSYGTLSFSELRSKLATVSPYELLLPALLLSIGPLVKMAIIPLHEWLPDAHAEAPTPISALLSPAMIGIGGWALARILLYSMPQVLELVEIKLVLMALAVATMVYGSLCALAQDDIKRLLAYSSISQMGYMLLGIASGTRAGLVGAALIYVSHGLAKAALFMVSGFLYHELGTRSISRMRGLARAMPLSATTTLAAFLCLAGVPPLVGFWAEVEVFLGAVVSALKFVNLAPLVGIVLAIVATTLTAGYGLWTVKRVFYGELPKGYTIKESFSVMSLVPFVLSAAAVVAGVYPAHLVKLASLIR